MSNSSESVGPHTSQGRQALNSELNKKEFYQGKVSLQSRPRMLFIELTRGCNLACPMCRDHVSNGDGLRMSDGLLEKIAEDILPYVECVDLRSQGESTLDSRLMTLASRLSRMGIRVNLYTNLTTHNTDYWFDIGRSSLNLGLSIDAVSPDLYGELRWPADFERMTKNLSALVRGARTRIHRKDIHLSAVISDANICEIPKLVRFASDYSILTLRLNPITVRKIPSNYPQIGISDDCRNLLRDNLEEACTLAARLGVRLELAATLDRSDKGGWRRCLHPWSYCVIDYDGGVVFCDHLSGLQNAVMGNLLEHSFTKIWNSDKYQQLRTEHLERQFVRMKQLGIECDWCYYNRYADCETLFEPAYRSCVLC